MAESTVRVAHTRSERAWDCELEMNETKSSNVRPVAPGGSAEIVCAGRLPDAM